jgi:tetratricopeptide (TPR) repeat protein|tara:strand:+ start:505 stop:975 length:471 start_codon:yes stop_codon:yes gene_type:complete
MKKILILLLFVSFNAIGAGTSSSTDDSTQTADQIIKLYELAEKHIDNQSYNKSLKLLKKLTKREDLGTKRADIYNLLGFSYRKLENPDLDKSFAAYMMAIELDPSHLGAHEYLGELYLMRDQKDKALIILEKLDQLAGSNSEEYKELKIAIDEYQS